MLLAQDPAPETTVVPITDLEPTPVSTLQGSCLAAVARAATLGVQVYPSVAFGGFSITGEPHDMHLIVRVAFIPSPDNQRIQDEIRHELIPGLETIIGAPFRDVTLDYTVAEPARQPATTAA